MLVNRDGGSGCRDSDVIQGLGLCAASLLQGSRAPICQGL